MSDARFVSGSPPPCPCCGTILIEYKKKRDEYTYRCPDSACRWIDGGGYDYQRLTVATAPWTRDVWAEVERARDTLAARVRELEEAQQEQADRVATLRIRVAMVGELYHSGVRGRELHDAVVAMCTWARDSAGSRTTAGGRDDS